MNGRYIAPSIKVIDNFISYADDLISLVTSLPQEAWAESGVQNHGGGYVSERQNSVRSSREISITPKPNRPQIFYNLRDRIYGEAKDYALENGFVFSHMEDINLLEYPPDSGFFDRHVDAGPSYPRSMSALLYLNEVEHGGETWFDKFGLMIKPERAKLVLFPASFPYSHQALPPVGQSKYVVVTWFGEMLDENVFKEYYYEVE